MDVKLLALLWLPGRCSKDVPHQHHLINKNEGSQGEFQGMPWK